MKITFTVSSLKSCASFTAIVHTHTSPEQFFLDPQDFYLRWGKAIPQGNHHELELIAPSTETLRKKPLHVHAVAKSQNLFVCYPLHIPTIEGAVRIFRLWCLGAVLKWEYDIDLNTVRDGECGGDDLLFLEILRNRYSITTGEAAIE